MYESGAFMSWKVIKASLLAAILVVTGTAQAQDNPFAWAYPPRTSDNAPQADARDSSPHRLPGSDREYVFSAIGPYSPADWHPDSHPPMPDIVSKGREPVMACAYCHLANGQGKTENAMLAGQPAAYIVQQLKDFAAGLRNTSDATLTTVANMLPISANATDTEMQAAADYFASVTPRKWITVIEAGTVPRTYIASWLHVALKGGGSEPLGLRILEMPKDDLGIDRLRGRPRIGLGIAISNAPNGGMTARDSLLMYLLAVLPAEKPSHVPAGMAAPCLVPHVMETT